MCDGRWGSAAAWLGERIRRACDLEHWATFHDSFEQLVDLLRDISRGAGGAPPATITILGGDVHTTYAVEVDLGPGAGTSKVFQLVCSPFRNPMGTGRRRIVKAAGGRFAATVFGTLARAGRVPQTAVRWDYLSPRTFDNTIGELLLDEASAQVTLRRSKRQDEPGDWLKVVAQHSLADLEA
jgi:hypothetical protein